MCGLNEMRKSFNITTRTNTQSSMGPGFTGRIPLSRSQSEIGLKATKDVKVELKDVNNEIRTIKAIFTLIKQAVILF